MDHERTGQVKSIQRADDRRVGLTCPREERGGYADAVDGLPERGEPLMQKGPFVIVQVGTVNPQSPTGWATRANVRASRSTCAASSGPRSISRALSVSLRSSTVPHITVVTPGV